jgi:hypothetical protein
MASACVRDRFDLLETWRDNDQGRRWLRIIEGRSRLAIAVVGVGEIFSP